MVMLISMYACMYVCMYVCMYNACVYVYACVHMCKYIAICMNIHYCRGMHADENKFVQVPILPCAMEQLIEIV